MPTYRNPHVVENNVRKYRLEKGWTTTDLSMAFYKNGLKVSARIIETWESQKYQPNKTNQKMLIRIFGKKPDLFIYSTPEK